MLPRAAEAGSKSGGATVTYANDALGRRIQRSSTTGGTTKFVYDGADVVRDLDGVGATIADYLNGPRHRQQAAADNFPEPLPTSSRIISAQRDLSQMPAATSPQVWVTTPSAM